jgi:hypothetical protein
MHLVHAFNHPLSGSVNAREKIAAAGGPAAAIELASGPSSAVEQTAGHLWKVFGSQAEQDRVPHRRHIHFPQRLFDVDEALIAPHGTNKHLRIPFEVRDCL